MILDITRVKPEDRLLVSPYVPDHVWHPLTWKERLFSWPWRPWVRSRWEKCIQAYVIDAPNGQTVLVVSPHGYWEILKRRAEDAVAT
jgi:hypothetical protein